MRQAQGVLDLCGVGPLMSNTVLKKVCVDIINEFGTNDELWQPYALADVVSVQALPVTADYEVAISNRWVSGTIWLTMAEVLPRVLEALDG